MGDNDDASGPTEDTIAFSPKAVVGVNVATTGVAVDVIPTPTPGDDVVVLTLMFPVLDSTAVSTIDDIGVVSSDIPTPVADEVASTDVGDTLTTASATVAVGVDVAVASDCFGFVDSVVGVAVAVRTSLALPLAVFCDVVATTGIAVALATTDPLSPNVSGKVNIVIYNVSLCLYLSDCNPL